MVQFRGLSLYNFLRISLKEDPSLQVEPWQVMDYRKLSIQELLGKMRVLGVDLKEDHFLSYAESFDTPEELLECLCVEEEDLVSQEKLYLLVLELWRRLLPEKQSLSIFCDELDFLISLYDEGILEQEEEGLQKSLSELEDVLDRSVDQGARPQEIFQMVSSYLAHDLESFLYDYISDLIDGNNEVYASELLDGVIEYVSDCKWFEFLKSKLFASSNSPEFNALMSRLLEQAEESPDFSFLFEIAQFLVHRGETSLFSQCIKQMLPLIKIEGDLLEVLKLIADFYLCLDQEQEAKEVEQCILAREARGLDLSIDSRDVRMVEKLLELSSH